MRKIVKAIVGRIDIKYLSGVVLAGFIGSLLTLAVTSGNPVAHAQLAPGVPPFAGLRNVEVVWNTDVLANQPVVANCPTGKIAIGGGAGGGIGQWLSQTVPVGSAIGGIGGASGDTTTPATGWAASMGNGSPTDNVVTTYVICAQP